jgi:hypothetical protein
MEEVVDRVNQNSAAMDFLLRGGGVDARGEYVENGKGESYDWVWKRLGKDRYWYGSQASVDASQEIDIPLRPTDLVDVLGLGELDVPDSDDFQVRDDRYEIVVRQRDDRGRLYTAKRVRIDRRPPYLVREMTCYSPSGQPRVEAALSNYNPVQGSHVRVPRRIRISWPDRGGYMNLEFDAFTRFEVNRDVERRFLSPVERGRHVGRMERVDQPPPRADGW